MRLTIAVHRVSIDTVCRVSFTDRHIRLVVDCLEKLSNGNQSRFILFLASRVLVYLLFFPLFKLSLLDQFFREDLRRIYIFSIFDTF